MTRGSGRWLPVILLAVVAALSFWLERAVERQRPGAPPARNAPDFWASDFSVRNFDEQGRMRYTLRADEMIHFADRDSVELRSPQFVMQGDGLTHVLAKRAHVGPDGKRIDLSGDVSIVRRPPAGGEVTTLYTERMTLLPDLQEANGDAPVRIKRPGAEITGSGFTSNNKSGISTLGGRVHALVQPRNS
jgi:lipopolysaccharide export system protein LptC